MLEARGCHSDYIFSLAGCCLTHSFVRPRSRSLACLAPERLTAYSRSCRGRQPLERLELPSNLPQSPQFMVIQALARGQPALVSNLASRLIHIHLCSFARTCIRNARFLHTPGPACLAVMARRETFCAVLLVSQTLFTFPYFPREPNYRKGNAVAARAMRAKANTDSIQNSSCLRLTGRRALWSDWRENLRLTRRRK